MEVHPPEHAIHSWRDFFIHIATIVVGLLIAIALEQSVEALHHRHQRHTAEHNLRLELEDNHRLLAEDERQLKISLDALRRGMLKLQSLRSHTPSEGSFAATSFHWDGMSMAAWNTASSTGATNLMPFDDARLYADLYEQQRLINEQAAMYMRSVYRIATPLILLNKEPDALPSEDLALMEAGIQQSTAEVVYLLDLCHSMDALYAAEMPKVHAAE